MDNPLQIFSTEWTDDIETVLTNILENCSLISEHHKQEYKDLQETLKYFKSSCNCNLSRKQCFFLCVTCMVYTKDYDKY